MIGRWTMMVAGLAVAGCAAAATQEAGSMDVDQSVALACEPSPRMPLQGRASPYDSASITLGGAQARVCYGRPAVKGRVIFGELVPYDTLWRTGANEPTVLHLPFAAEVAGMRVEPGSYSLYTVPGRDRWTVVLNRSTSQWGHESQYNAAVRAQEVGRAVVPAERIQSPVEMFTIRSEPAGGNTAHLVLEWENTRVRIPIRRI